jgi:hypothetical protein
LKQQTLRFGVDISIQQVLISQSSNCKFVTGQIAIGQIGYGKYVLAQIGYGDYVWSQKSADSVAVEFFKSLVTRFIS